MRSVAAALALATLAIAAPAAAQSPDGAHPSMMRFDGTVLSVSAQADVQGKPDLATINAGVLTEAPTAEAAMQENATRMTAVIAALRKAGVAEKDIRTSNLSLNPQYQYVQNEPARLSGYQAQNSVTVKVRNLKRVGTAIDAVVAQGSNQINSIAFGIDDPDPLLDQARKDALKKARARAEIYAGAAGLKVARILSIVEAGEQSAPPYPVAMFARAATKPTTPVAPGEVSLTAIVNVTFELR